uniref:Uncharacterized protein n=1 Tax=Romanomermis culicivorax TaxID=13658 RepID=A0A915KHD5_ROMCU
MENPIALREEMRDTAACRFAVALSQAELPGFPYPLVAVRRTYALTPRTRRPAPSSLGRGLASSGYLST